ITLHEPGLSIDDVSNLDITMLTSYTTLTTELLTSHLTHTAVETGRHHVIPNTISPTPRILYSE
ncbi:uncharacterized, partial [Tachysurus ichikawai]